MRSTWKVLRFLTLLVLTAAAVLAMVLVSGKSRRHPSIQAESPSVAAAPATPVATISVEPDTIELFDIYSGMIRPWERYTVGFELGGRVQVLGTNEQGQPLDEGDRVSAGQVLARLDSETLEAHQREATARLTKAQSDLARVKTLRARNPGAVTDAEMLERETDEVEAAAALAIAVKNLEDAALHAPIDSYISHRRVKPGESVNPHQAAFELVQTDRVRLVLGVPESRVPEIVARLRTVQHDSHVSRDNPAQSDDPPQAASADVASATFKAYVELVGRDRFGRAWPNFTGTVHRVSETADDTTGLFEVEVALENPDRLLRPGMVARARLVTGQVQGFRVPASSVLFREDKAYLFAIEPVEADVQAMFFDVGSQRVQRARRMELSNWIEQGDDVIVPELPPANLRAIVRGQHRLVEGQLVELVGTPEAPRRVQPMPTLSAETIGSRPD